MPTAFEPNKHDELVHCVVYCIQKQSPNKAQWELDPAVVSADKFIAAIVQQRNSTGGVTTDPAMPFRAAAGPSGASSVIPPPLPNSNNPAAARPGVTQNLPSQAATGGNASNTGTATTGGTVTSSPVGIAPRTTQATTAFAPIPTAQQYLHAVQQRQLTETQPPIPNDFDVAEELLCLRRVRLARPYMLTAPMTGVGIPPLLDPHRPVVPHNTLSALPRPVVLGTAKFQFKGETIEAPPGEKRTVWRAQCTIPKLLPPLPPYRKVKITLVATRPRFVDRHSKRVIETREEEDMLFSPGHLPRRSVILTPVSHQEQKKKKSPAERNAPGPLHVVLQNLNPNLSDEQKKILQTAMVVPIDSVDHTLWINRRPVSLPELPPKFRSLCLNHHLGRYAYPMVEPLDVTKEILDYSLAKDNQPHITIEIAFKKPPGDAPWCGMFVVELVDCLDLDTARIEAATQLIKNTYPTLAPKVPERSRLPSMPILLAETFRRPRFDLMSGPPPETGALTLQGIPAPGLQHFTQAINGSPVNCQVLLIDDPLPQPRCAICKVTEKLSRCSQCKLEYYCGRDHQTQHWPTHKSLCKLYKQYEKRVRIEIQQDPAAAAAAPPGNEQSDPSLQLGQKRPRPEETNDDVSEIDEVECAEQKISLSDPLFLSRINIPARGRFCRHETCFDLVAFLEYTQNQAKNMSCPHCNQAILLEELGVSERTLDALQRFDESIEVVYVTPSGPYSKEPLSKDSEKRNQIVVDETMTSSPKLAAANATAAPVSTTAAPQSTPASSSVPPIVTSSATVLAPPPATTKSTSSDSQFNSGMKTSVSASTLLGSFVDTQPSAGPWNNSTQRPTAPASISVPPSRPTGPSPSRRTAPPAAGTSSAEPEVIELD